MSDIRDPSSEVQVQNGNREIVVKSGLIRPIIEFHVRGKRRKSMDFKQRGNRDI